MDEDNEKREIFAALAMNGLLSGQTMRHANTVIEHDLGHKPINVTVARSIALDAVVFADALIAALRENQFGDIPKKARDS